jgi:hypothetical protein
VYLTVLSVITIITVFPLTIMFPERAQITSSSQATHTLLQPAVNGSFGSSLGNYSSEQLLISNVEMVDFIRTLNVTRKLPSLSQRFNITGPIIGYSAVFMMNLSNYQSLEIDSLELKVFIASVARSGPVTLIWSVAPSDFAHLQSKSYFSNQMRIGFGDTISVIHPGIYAWRVKLGFTPGSNEQVIMELGPGRIQTEKFFGQTENLFGQSVYELDAVSVTVLSVKSNRPPDMEVTFVRKYDPPGAQTFGIWLAYGIVTIFAPKKWAESLYNLVFIASALWLIVPILIFRSGVLIGRGLSILLGIFFLLFVLMQVHHSIQTTTSKQKRKTR